MLVPRLLKYPVDLAPTAVLHFDLQTLLKQIPHEPGHRPLIVHRQIFDVGRDKLGNVLFAQAVHLALKLAIQLDCQEIGKLTNVKLRQTAVIAEVRAPHSSPSSGWDHRWRIGFGVLLPAVVWLPEPDSRSCCCC